MKTATFLALAGLAAARQTAYGPRAVVSKREVPQEHSHEKFLTAVKASLDLNNPLEIQDSVFALLGNAAAAKGAPNVDNLDCLQQIVADQAFTNAKAINDIDGMASALIFRALERNTGQVGLKSVLCDQQAVNPEIGALTQHQDPASEGAAALNAAITLALAQQLFLIGADPLLALQSGTFAPGQIGDPTAAGNTCDTVPDPVGCIFTENLLVEDVSQAEIQQAVAEVQGGAAAKIAPGATGSSNAAAASNAGASKAAASNAGASNAAAAANNNVQASATVNVQSFTGNLGAAPVPVISSASERPFAVNGATFLNIGAAIQRSCAVQQNACANAANSNQIDASVSDCQAQEQACLAANNLKRMARRTTGHQRRQGSATVNVQTFAGALGGPAPAVISSAAERPFAVNGATFLNKGAAIQRSCAIQQNACANAANSNQIDADVGQCVAQEQACRASANVKRQAGALDFGSCSDPSIIFANGLDGRKEASFAPAEGSEFNHGSALNIGIISSFICGQLQSSCKADAAAVAACNQGAAAAGGLKGQAAADAFNKALGL